MKKYQALIFLFLFTLCKEESQNSTVQKESADMTKIKQTQAEEKKESRFVPPSGVYVMDDSVKMSSFLSAEKPDNMSYCLEIDLEKWKAIAKFRKYKKQYEMEIENLGERKYALVFKGKRRELELQEYTFQGLVGYEFFFYDYSYKNNKGQWNGGSAAGKLSKSHQSVAECDKYYEDYYESLEGVTSEETM